MEAGKWIREGSPALIPVSIGLSRRDSYLKIKLKIKHLQTLKLNIFVAKIKHSLEKKLSKFDKT